MGAREWVVVEGVLVGVEGEGGGEGFGLDLEEVGVQR